MKYLIIGLAILAVLLTACVGCGTAADRRLTELERTLRRAEESIVHGRFAEVRQTATEASELWRSYSVFFGGILSHAELEEITCRLERVKAYAAAEDLPELYASYAELLEAVAHLRETDDLRLENLL